MKKRDDRVAAPRKAGDPRRRDAGQHHRVNALLRQLRGKPLAEPVTALWFALLLILTVTEPLDEPAFRANEICQTSNCRFVSAVTCCDGAGNP
jgi:hypothetical protein